MTMTNGICTFLRLAVSRDKEGILALAQNGVEIQRPKMLLKVLILLNFKFARVGSIFGR